MGEEVLRPEWAPRNAGAEFACRVLPGVEDETGRRGFVAPPPRKLGVEDYVEGILAGNRMVLSRAITLIESNAPKHFDQGQEILQRILPRTGGALRLGITGVPGVGKSTTIEALGCHLCDRGHRVAVLAVDPSSTLSRGSILGDKTRMERLSRRPEAFIRPSPSGGTLGGVTRKSRETLLLCEAAGYDVVLVETVGVGQGETTVRSMVDHFILLVLTGAGDDLQGIKKGILELADAIWVNKADGANRQKALATRADYEQILHYIRPATEGWRTRAHVCSALTGEGIDRIWEVAREFRRTTAASGVLEQRRRQQTLVWVRAMTQEHLQNRIARNAALAEATGALEERVLRGELPPTLAAQGIIAVMEKVLFGEDQESSLSPPAAPGR